MDMQRRYRDMADRLKPLAWDHLTANQQAMVDACLRAGEPYEAMLDLLWVAGVNGADKNLVADAVALLDDEDKDEFMKLLE